MEPFPYRGAALRLEPAETVLLCSVAILLVARSGRGTGLEREKVTIRDVARQANVGIGTVSRVLSGSRNVNDQTRKHVEQIIERLGYTPNRAARNLVKGRTKTIGVLVPSFTRHYFLEILRGVQTAASDDDYSLVVLTIERPEQVAAQLVAHGLRQRFDGLIVISVDADLVQANPLPPVPLVGVDTFIEGASSIAADHTTAMYLSARHLISHGHRRLALIDRPQDPVAGNSIAARREGFLAACREGGLQPLDLVIETQGYSADAGYAAATRLLALPDPPTAFSCGSDVQGIGVLRAVAEAGHVIGSDVAVVGYHDVDLAEYACLTSVQLSGFEIGRQAVAQLLRELDAELDRPERHTVAPTLTVRASCGCTEESRLFGWPGFFAPADQSA